MFISLKNSNSLNKTDCECLIFNSKTVSII